MMPCNTKDKTKDKEAKETEEQQAAKLELPTTAGAPVVSSAALPDQDDKAPLASARPRPPKKK